MLYSYFIEPITKLSNKLPGADFSSFIISICRKGLQVSARVALEAIVLHHKKHLYTKEAHQEESKTHNQEKLMIQIGIDEYQTLKDSPTLLSKLISSIGDLVQMEIPWPILPFFTGSDPDNFIMALQSSGYSKTENVPVGLIHEDLLDKIFDDSGIQKLVPFLRIWRTHKVFRECVRDIQVFLPFF